MRMFVKNFNAVAELLCALKHFQVDNPLRNPLDSSSEGLVIQAALYEFIKRRDKNNQYLSAFEAPNVSNPKQRDRVIKYATQAVDESDTACV